VYFEIQNTMRWFEGDTVKCVSLLRIHFLTHNLRGRSGSSSIKLLISSVKPSQVEQFLNEKYGHEKISSCLRDDAPATGVETVLVCVDT